MLKRALDIVGSAAALVLLAPVMAVVAVMVRVKLGSPILFRQTRPGLDEVPFEIYKFRTMVDKTDSTGALLPDADRLTGFGRFLRASSLDELPELINVLKGEMSLVGPRPLLMRYLDRYPDEIRRRHDVKPGVTGLAQVEGRNALSWDEKFALDLDYVDNNSLRRDLAILARTAKSVITRSGISHADHSTMPEFFGDD